ncbi:hypothetical protein [Hymenobacter sp. DG25A]|uniref:hypothetical protein n=1 Tax=Hymenobacter sp. DG25A TaxID=1385663 RepID=UPI0006BDB496|nr:hypothetical protein [Hymenobacter sp. DG25A]ALD20008.1 hypothetical protein AM218_00670 [Hymenobacter sp. DG25A]
MYYSVHFALALLLLLSTMPGYAQHKQHQIKQPAATDTTRRPAAPMDHSQHHMPGMAPADTARPAAPMNHAGHNMDMMPGMNHGTMDMGTMPHAYSRQLPMNRNGSGTAWNPDQTPMYMWMSHHGKWMVMNHGAIYLRYTNQNIGRNGAQRGGLTFDAPNWFMTMAQREVGAKGLLNLTAMFSLDPLTEGGNGYPLLFQSGEAYQGRPLVDRQHPHDLFSSLSIGYTHSFSEDIDLTAYVGYPGEPAIGPVAFMHRISAMPNADASLGHHWQDATHITFGVATLGLRYKQFKLEGSNFTGREPDEHRYNFDKPRADSWAGRLNWNPTSNLALQVSRAFLRQPEVLHPNEDVKRTTASIIQSNQWSDGRYLASALVWGMNQNISDEHSHTSHSVLAETNLQLGKPAVYGRYEFVQKSAEELQTETVILLPNDNPAEGPFNIHALTLGTTYRVAQVANTDLTLGAQGTVYRPEEIIRPLYGKTPVSAQVYLRLNPSLMKMSKM